MGWLIETSLYIAIIQVVVAAMSAGFLSDRFGRRRVAIALSIVHVCASFLTFGAKFVGSLQLYLAARFFVGGSVHAVWATMFVHCMETSVKSKRALITCIVCYGK